jgi:hypothetical protein
MISYWQEIVEHVGCGIPHPGANNHIKQLVISKPISI